MLFNHRERGGGNDLGHLQRKFQVSGEAVKPSGKLTAKAALRMTIQKQRIFKQD
jgi:hypothetical protein